MSPKHLMVTSRRHLWRLPGPLGGAGGTLPTQPGTVASGRTALRRDALNRLRQCWHYLTKVFDRPARLRAVRTNRSEADIPDPPLTLSLLLAAWLRRPSLLRLQTDTARRGWQRLIGWAGRISDDAFAYALALYRLDDLRGVLLGVNQRLKQNQQFERAKIQGLLVVAVDANEQFHTRCRCGPQCSQRSVTVSDRAGQKREATEYYHRQVYAHLDGLNFSTVLEVDPVRPGEEEAQAALRLLGRIRRGFQRDLPELPADRAHSGLLQPLGANPKLEVRNPKEIRNPKSEIRIVAEPQSAGLARLGCRDGSRKGC